MILERSNGWTYKIQMAEYLSYQMIYQGSKSQPRLVCDNINTWVEYLAKLRSDSDDSKIHQSSRRQLKDDFETTWRGINSNEKTKKNHFCATNVKK